MGAAAVENNERILLMLLKDMDIEILKNNNNIKNTVSEVFLETALELACTYGNKEVADILLHFSSTFFHKEKEGILYKLLQLSAWYQHPECVKCILEFSNKYSLTTTSSSKVSKVSKVTSSSNSSLL